jgi:SAM-dependent methyltransferase
MQQPSSRVPARDDPAPPCARLAERRRRPARRVVPSRDSPNAAVRALAGRRRARLAGRRRARLHAADRWVTLAAMSSEFWDERFTADDYVYGVEPNDFLRAEAPLIPPGRVLSLGEGEGRNAVFLASLGHAVTAVDFSAAGLRKAERLARARGVTLDLVQADLTSYEPAPDTFTGVVMIFAHLLPDARARLLPLAARALRPGGRFVSELYRPEQMGRGTGGPRDPALLPTLAELRAHLAELELVIARDVEREIHEGPLHGGASATVQIVGVRR